MPIHQVVMSITSTGAIMNDRSGVLFRSRLFLWTIFTLGVGLFSAAIQPAHALQSIRIGTGGSSGVYYPIGKLIAQGITLQARKADSPLHGFIGIAQNSAGSIENARAVVAGELEAGLVQADIASYALKKQREFAAVPDSDKLRAIACLYSEKFQLVVRNDSGISSFAEIRGKRISVDEPGSGTRKVTDIVLAAHGLDVDDLRPQYLKPSFTGDKMRSGQLDGFSMMAGVPMTAVTTLLSEGIHLLAIEPETARKINADYPFLTPGVIDGDVYPGLAETPTIEVYALFVVSSDMSDDIAFSLAEALFSPETTRLLEQGHPQGKDITLESALKGLSIPLHPGAERFYESIGGSSK